VEREDMNRLPQVRVVAGTLALLLGLVTLPAATLGQAGDATVAAQNFAFAPGEIHIAPGGSVVWTNGDPQQHTVTADDGSFDSGGLNANGALSSTFTDPGRYAYYCTFHGGPGGSGMAGVIIVDPN